MSNILAPGIYAIPDCFTVDECRSCIADSERSGYEAALLQTRKGAVRDEEVRNNSRVLQSDYTLAALLWARLQSHVPAFLSGRQAIGINECFRFYRYEPQQRFTGHTDGSFRRENGEESRLTLLIYLNDNFAGGETAFADVTVVPRMGMALAFRHELFHEGCPVISGTKYVLRTDVMYNPVGTISG